MATTPSTKTTVAATLPKRNPKTGRFEKGPAKPAVAKAKPTAAAKPAVAPAKPVAKKR